uniref:Uncharacterized protein n=1 Tax=Anguilla anguilla TaxID=7936 RepID=A0A0E9U343_ANGAN
MWWSHKKACLSLISAISIPLPLRLSSLVQPLTNVLQFPQPVQF